MIDHHSRAILVTLDVPNPVQDALDARFGILQRSPFPTAFNLGLVVTSYEAYALQIRHRLWNDVLT